jgi:hypothetical protein
MTCWLDGTMRVGFYRAESLLPMSGVLGIPSKGLLRYLELRHAHKTC